MGKVHVTYFVQTQKNNPKCNTTFISYYSNWFRSVQRIMLKYNVCSQWLYKAIKAPIKKRNTEDKIRTLHINYILYPNSCEFISFFANSCEVILDDFGRKRWRKIVLTFPLCTKNIWWTTDTLECRKNYSAHCLLLCKLEVKVSDNVRLFGKLQLCWILFNTT